MIAGAYILAIGLAVRFGAGEKRIGIFYAGSHVARGDRHATLSAFLLDARTFAGNATDPHGACPMRERSPTCWAITRRMDSKSLPKLQAYIEGPFNGMLRLFTENRDLRLPN